MSLSAGDRLGVYEIQALLGAGGMGEVYRARDARLQREVAIKVLPAAFASDSERMARFEQEARAAAALNHPNILAVHDLGQHDGAPFIVTELLDGASLRELVHGGPLPLRKALEYGIQIAQGLAAAHEKGIVHRDLKPDNVFITSDGRVKILDFGLAKLTQPEAAASSMSVLPTTPAFTQVPNTAAGVVMGTMGYMAPEQVRGSASDHRTDIFALGVVLYEMLAGRRAFGGDTAMDVMSAILKEDPVDLPVVERHIPPALTRIVARCLEKNPAVRFQSARDLAFALDSLTAPSGSGATETARQSTTVAAAVPGRRTALVPWGIAAVAAVVAAVLAFVHFRESEPEARTVRFEIAPPGGTPAEMLALSPDGRLLAFIAQKDGPPQIWVRALDAVEAHPLAGTENAIYPFWSADASYIGFFAQGKLKKIAVAGGPAVALCDSPSGRGGSWNAAGVIIYSAGPTSPILQVSANGGTPIAVTKLSSGDAGGGARFPSFLPDGDHFLYLATSGGSDIGVHVASLSSGTSERLLPDTSNAVFARSNGNGYVLFRREETLMAQRFDLDTLKLSGDVIPITSPVPITYNLGFGAFSASLDGTLIFRRDATRSRELVWIDREGKRLSSATKPLQIYDSPIALSPDSKRVAYSITSGDRLAELWVHDLSRDLASRFTFAAGVARDPVWSADGSVLYFGFMRAGAVAIEIHRKALSGNGQDERLIESGINGQPTSLSRDGQLLLFNQTATKTDSDIWVLPLTGEPKPVPYLQTPFGESDAVFAPVPGPARWVAYTSNESGRGEVYLQQYPTSGVKYQVSTAGGAGPLWRADGRELYYAENGAIYAVPIAVGASIDIGTPKMLARNPNILALTAAGDGQRFLAAVPAGGSDAAQPITAVLNWAAAVKR
jgi:Tol biopolymer transport system component/tRNA A-37 threonylcarbamoyl transferase component Bud32